MIAFLVKFQFWVVFGALFTLLAVLVQAQAKDGVAMNAHDFQFRTVSGEIIDLADYADKVVLVVNTASQCNFTEQYGPLQALYDKYRERGLVVVGIPSNDFGGQEPGTDKQIIAFTDREFSVSFPITVKTRVKGPRADPFYHWAGEQAGMLGKPRWNFHKYLIGPDGELVTWFSSFTSPDSRKLADAIESALPAPEG